MDCSLRSRSGLRGVLLFALKRRACSARTPNNFGNYAKVAATHTCACGSLTLAGSCSIAASRRSAVSRPHPLVAEGLRLMRKPVGFRGANQRTNPRGRSRNTQVLAQRTFTSKKREQHVHASPERAAAPVHCAGQYRPAQGQSKKQSQRPLMGTSSNSLSILFGHPPPHPLIPCKI
jgi:hypothetical protein